MPITLLPIEGVPEVRPGDDLAQLLSQNFQFQAGDVLVVTQKVVSKAEGRLVALDTVRPGNEALAIAERYQKDARVVELVLSESQELLRRERGILISRTHHGWVCANAGLDLSNVDGGRSACLLPVDGDASASALREALRGLTGVELGVVISDSFGRPWRLGIVNVAIGVAGLAALRDHRGESDTEGMEMQATVMATADLLASAAELASGKTAGVPAVVVRGFEAGGQGRAQDLVRPRDQFLFD